MTGLARDGSSLLRAFHKDVNARAMVTGTGIAALGMLQTQLGNHEEAFKNLGTSSQTKITEQQKEINRSFVPVIRENMEYVYQECMAISGMFPAYRKVV